MTICIASICEANTGLPRIVFCSDRLVTDSNGLTFEQGIPKIVELLPNCLIMNAGDGACGDAIIKDVFLTLSGIEKDKLETIGIKQIAELVKHHYDLQRDNAIENQIFKPMGMDRKYFYSNMKQFYDWLALMVDTRVQNFNFDIAFIILGFDIDQQNGTVIPVLYEISESGLQYWTPNGFAMVGIGSFQSLPEITKEAYNVNMRLSECLVKAFWAKKLSERMTGVGKDTTDLGVLLVDIDKQTKKLVSRNTLLNDDFKKELLSKAFEHQKKVIASMTTKVQANINAVFTGQRTIGRQQQPNKA